MKIGTKIKLDMKIMKIKVSNSNEGVGRGCGRDIIEIIKIVQSSWKLIGTLRKTNQTSLEKWLQFLDEISKESDKMKGGR